MPVALLLLKRNATVTVAHSKTANLRDVIKEADIVIASVGKANFVTADMLKPGAVVIDVGINAIEDTSASRGELLSSCFSLFYYFYVRQAIALLVMWILLLARMWLP